MLERYIKDNNSIGLKIKDFSDISEEIKVKLNKETMPEETFGFWNLISSIISMVLGFILLAWIIFTMNWVIYLVSFIIFVLVAENTARRKDELKVKQQALFEEEKEIRINQEILNLLSEGKDIKIIGKIHNNQKNDITGNIKNEYIGEAYISFSDNLSDMYTLIILNYKDYYSASKSFTISDIVICKEFQMDYDESHYSVDTTKLESALDEANRASIERSISRSVGVNQSLMTNISQDRKLIALKKAERELEKNIKDMNKKQKNETVFLMLKFKDGSSFYINYINEDTLHLLQKVIENN